MNRPFSSLMLCLVFSVIGSGCKPEDQKDIQNRFTENMKFLTLDEKDKASCFAACANYTGSAYCLPIKYDNQISENLKKLSVRLQQKNTPIPAAWLRQTFGVSEDPCERTDSNFSENSWKNSGYACTISATIQPRPNRTLNVKVDVPPVVKAEVGQVGNFNVYKFYESAVMLYLDDAVWHNDWGGEIRYVATNDKKTMFQMSRGCVSVDFNR